jgi:hypothetical protein
MPSQRFIAECLNRTFEVTAGEPRVDEEYGVRRGA